MLFNSGDTLYEVGEEPNFLLIILRGTYDCTQYSIESTRESTALLFASVGNRDILYLFCFAALNFLTPLKVVTLLLSDHPVRDAALVKVHCHLIKEFTVSKIHHYNYRAQIIIILLYFNFNH